MWLGVTSVASSPFYLLKDVKNRLSIRYNNLKILIFAKS